ncbi:hypothetical protein FSP39_022361 [Pinctada imbricata]|uniref:Uncharacterized protein n=1 Tax=Pinctada imbricata TaxID=66713 RepID=A0AA88YFC8_PINIB|nr:hypothetical protein FSP39_022361 [Pinctada imbricata]
MEKKKASCDRRGVQSLYIPTVPKIILNSTDTPDSATNTITHSRSAGELDSYMDNEGRSHDKSVCGASYRECNGSNSSQQNSLDIYCSPRLQRRSFNFDASTESNSAWTETVDSAKLGPGSRVGSTISLTSEYTARSIGLISNDSSSDSAQFSDKIEQIKQKQNLLRRYVSNPEKPQSDVVPDGTVHRNTKSVNNLQMETGAISVTDFDSDSMDDFIQSSEIHEQMKRHSRKDSFDSSVSDSRGQTLVTMVTDDISVKEGRIRQWLTGIGADGGT